MFVVFMGDQDEGSESVWKGGLIVGGSVSLEKP